MLISKIQKNKIRWVAGFTLLELLVTMSIFVILTVLVLANQHKLNNTLGLSNLAYDVSLSVRQSQTYGYAVKGQGTGGSPSEFQNSFGVHFNLSASASYIVFADSFTAGTKGKYDSGVDQIVQNYALQNGYTFTALCSEDNNESCYPVGDSLDVTFVRPNSNAIINIWQANGTQVTPSPNHIRIKLRSPDNLFKGIDVYSSGQISVVDISG